jgi:hypothetical protein
MKGKVEQAKTGVVKKKQEAVAEVQKKLQVMNVTEICKTIRKSGRSWRKRNERKNCSKKTLFDRFEQWVTLTCKLQLTFHRKSSSTKNQVFQSF